MSNRLQNAFDIRISSLTSLAAITRQSEYSCQTTYVAPLIGLKSFSICRFFDLGTLNLEMSM